MTRRVRIRLALGAAGLAAAAIVAVVAVGMATSAPELPPPPLPPATAQPGPPSAAQLTTTAAAPVAAGVREISAVSSGLDPNVEAARDDAARLTDLAYVNGTRRGTAAPPRCDLSGHWLLTVNPLGVVGRPYASPPHAQDWARAAVALAVAQGICPVAVVLTWYRHDGKHPSTDVWSATLPATVAAGMNGAHLRHYARQHARQL